MSVARTTQSINISCSIPRSSIISDLFFTAIIPKGSTVRDCNVVQACFDIAIELLSVVDRSRGLLTKT